MQIVKITKENQYAFVPYGVEDWISVEKNGIYLGLVEKNISCGAIGGHYGEEKEFVISNFFVDPLFRGYGGGKLLLRSLLESVCSTARRVEISYTLEEKACEVFDSLLEKNGFFVCKKELPVFLVRPSQALCQAAKFSKNWKEKGHVFPLYELPSSMLDALGKKERIPDTLHFNRFLFMADYQCSLAYVSKGEILSYIVITSAEDGQLELAAAYSNQTNKGAFLSLIGPCVEKVVEKYGAEKLCYICALHEMSENLIKLIVRNGIEKKLLLHSYAYVRGGVK